MGEQLLSLQFEIHLGLGVHELGPDCIHGRLDVGHAGTAAQVHRYGGVKGGLTKCRVRLGHDREDVGPRRMIGNEHRRDGMRRPTLARDHEPEPENVECRM